MMPEASHATDDPDDVPDLPSEDKEDDTEHLDEPMQSDGAHVKKALRPDHAFDGMSHVILSSSSSRYCLFIIKY